MAFYDIEDKNGSSTYHGRMPRDSRHENILGKKKEDNTLSTF